MNKFIIVQKRPHGASQVSIANYVAENGRRVQKRQQLGVLDADGKLMIKQGLKLNAEEKRLLKAKGIAVSQQASPGPGRPMGRCDRVKAAVIATGGLESHNAKGWKIKEVGRTAVLENLAKSQV